MIAIFIALMLMGLTNPASAQSTNTSLQSTAVLIPDGKDGIHFDDINYSTGLHKLLVPAGHTGKLYLIDPVTYAMTPISGFSSSVRQVKGVDVGISSADEGEGFIFVADHGTQKLDVVDTKTGAIVTSAPLAADVDFIRYVDVNHEVWATEPDENKIIEVFKFTTNDKPMLYHSLDITFSEGPESLTVDPAHHMAYTNLGKQAVSIDLHTHAVTAQWPNGCEKSRGTAVDEQKGFLFVGCGEGKAVVLDLKQNGKQVSTLSTGAGVDLIDYNPGLSHLYITSGKSATLSVLGVSPKGELSLLGVGQAANRAHCVAGDDQNNIWVCDPKQGQLLRYRDTLAAVK